MKLSVSFGDLLGLLVVANLVSGEKIAYRSKGRGGSASLSGGYCGDWPFESSIYVYAAQDVTKVKGDGKPEKTVNPYMSAFFSLWTDCSAGSATLIQPQWYDFPDPTKPTLEFPGNNKLEKGTAAGVFPALAIPCTLVTQTYDDGSQYFYYNCDYTVSSSIWVDIVTLWTGTGETYQSRSKSSGNYPGGSYKVSTTGKTRDASVDFEVIIDNVPLDVDTVFGTVTYEDGSLFKSTFSEMSEYTIYIK
jgi:hypothetical protein